MAVDGDVVGGGLTGGYTATLEECKKDCDARLDCNSLKYSPGSTLCVLMNERTPTSSKYQDHQFCKRLILGKRQRRINIHSMYYNIIIKTRV